MLLKCQYDFDDGFLVLVISGYNIKRGYSDVQTFKRVSFCVDTFHAQILFLHGFQKHNLIHVQNQYYFHRDTYRFLSKELLPCSRATAQNRGHLIKVSGHRVGEWANFFPCFGVSCVASNAACSM